MYRLSPSLLLVASGLCLLSFAETARAQTGPELLLKPFRQSDQFEFNSDYLYGFETETDAPDGAADGYDYRIDVYNLTGRLRLSPGQSERGLARAQPRAGFAINHVDLDTDDPRLPDELYDRSVAIGMGVLAYDGWLGGLSVGIGEAGVGSETDANDTYFQADFAVGKTFSNGVDSFGLVIDYNGNRSFLPDWPLVGFQYRKRLDSPRQTPRGPSQGPPAIGAEPGAEPGADSDFEGYDPQVDPARLILSLGFPFSGLAWRPTDKLQVNVNFTIPDAFAFRTDYQLLGDNESGAGLYASLSRTNNPYHWNELPRDDRIFLRQNRIETGLIWRLDDRIEVIAAGGYLFGQEFETGFDTRDTATITDVDDAPYVRGLVNLRL